MSTEPRQTPVNRVRLPRWWFLVLVAVAVVSVAGITFLRSSTRQPQWSLTRVAEAIQNGEIARIDVSGTDMTVVLKDGSTVYSSMDPSSSVFEQLVALGVSVDQLARIELSIGTNWDNAISGCAYLIPLAAFLGAFAWLLRRAVRIQQPATLEKGGTQDDKSND